MGKDRLKDKRRVIELAATLVLACVVVWQYGSLAPRVIIVLSFLLSLAVALVQLPFLLGYYGTRRFKPITVILLIALPCLIALGYGAVYSKNLLLLWYEEWLGNTRFATAAIAVVALPGISFLFGHLGRKIRRI